MVSVDALWQLAINDPHLMRLGEFLARTSGREGSEDELESSFLVETSEENTGSLQLSVKVKGCMLCS